MPDYMAGFFANAPLKKDKISSIFESIGSFYLLLSEICFLNNKVLFMENILLKPPPSKLVLHAYKSHLTELLFFSLNSKKRDLASNYSWEYDFTVANTGCHYQ